MRTAYDARKKGLYIFASGVISKMHNKIHGRQIRSRLWGLHLPSAGQVTMHMVHACIVCVHVACILLRIKISSQ